jgi:flavin-dependent dehydrogenase
MTGYDAIVVGARCAGAPTAMLLARRGHRVLLVDRARFPSDTVSTHLIHPPGVAALRRWDLLDRLAATGCPPVTKYSFDFGPFVISGTPPPADGTGTAYCPRRTVLDKLLVNAASEAGAEVREGFTVHGLHVEDGQIAGIRGGSGTGGPVTERARVVIGADGAHSQVAQAAHATSYQRKPMLSVGYYSYWSGFPVKAAGWAVRPGRGYGAFPTHDGLTMVLAAWPRAEFQSVKRDVLGNYLHAVREAYGDQLTGARREERVVGGGVANHFRRPFGPGWALVGDAGYLKDPVTAQGITDAFLGAELCAAALGAALAGRRPFDEAMAGYQRRRDSRVMPMYEFTAQLASMEPPPPGLQQLLAAIADRQEAMDQFAGLIAGTVSPAEFFDPARVQSRPGSQA